MAGGRRAELRGDVAGEGGDGGEEVGAGEVALAVGAGGGGGGRMDDGEAGRVPAGGAVECVGDAARLLLLRRRRLGRHSAAASEVSLAFQDQKRELALVRKGRARVDDKTAFAAASKIRLRTWLTHLGDI